MKIQNVQMEAMFLASLYKKPDLYVEFGNLIKSNFDFSDDINRDFYDWFELFYNTQSDEVTENKFTIFITQDEVKNKKYREYGGWKTISKMMNLCDENDVDNYFSILKKFSLLREFEYRGFPVNKIMEKKNFDSMKPEDIVSLMRYNVDHINTVIGGSKTASILGHNMKEKLQEWKLKPEIGIPLADWNILTNQLRGMRKKKILFNGMLSNQGKSRNMMYLASYIGLILKKRVLILANEMDENDMLACMMTTVLNNDIFSHKVNKIEREIVLGQYKDNEEEKINKVAEWIEDNTNIFFLEMNSYSDKDLEREIKKYVLGRGVEYIFYDTLKGHKNEDWASIKQTGTMLKDLCNELEVAGWATIQLTDETINIKPHEMSSMNIASAKHLKHIADSLTLYKQLQKKEYESYFVISDEYGEIPLDFNKTYYYCKLDKNRAGTKLDVLFEVDLDRNVWKELGFAGVK